MDSCPRTPVETIPVPDASDRFVVRTHPCKVNEPGCTSGMVTYEPLPNENAFLTRPASYLAVPTHAEPPPSSSVTAPSPGSHAVMFSTGGTHDPRLTTYVTLSVT